MDMDTQENRRAQLRKWIALNGTPAKEKSYFSQLAGGSAPFGEKAAGRIEKQYGMGSGYLDSNADPIYRSGTATHKSGAIDASNIQQNATLIAKLGESERPSIHEEDLPSPTSDEFAYVPQLDIAAACGNGRFEDHVVVKGGLAFKKSFLRDKGVPEHAARIIYAAGGSMSPTLQDGCVVLLNLADTEPRDGKVYAICKPDDGLVLKRLIWDFHPSMGRHTWIMRSDNPDKIAHPDKMLPPDDRTMIAGRAVWNDNQL